MSSVYEWVTLSHEVDDDQAEDSVAMKFQYEGHISMQL